MTTASPARVNKNVILVISTTSAFILPFLIAAINVALPTMGRELNMSAVVMTWVSTSYFLAIAIVQVPFGRLSDILGRRLIFILGLLITTGGSFLGGFSNSISMLLISRILQGLGSGMTYNSSISILTSVFPGKERVRAIGISQAGTYLGLSLGPLFGGLLTETLGWQSIFLISGILGVLLIIMVFQGLKAEWKEARGEKFDTSGSIIYAIGIASFMYGFSSLPSITGIVFFIAGAAVMAFFIWWESKSPSPVLNLALFRHNRVFIFSNIAVVITYISTFAINYLLSLYLQYIKGSSADYAGAILIFASVLMTVFTVISGFISQRKNPRVLAAIGMAIDCAATIMLIFLGSSTPMWYIMLSLAVYGIGIGLFVTPNTNIIIGAVESKALGVVSGIMGTMRTAGMMISMAITMILFSVYIGQAEITPGSYPQFLTSVRVGFIIFSLFGVLGIVSQAIARNGEREKP